MKRLQELRALDIDQLYLDLAKRLSAHTHTQVHDALGACLPAAVRRHMIPISPMQHIESRPAAGEPHRGAALDAEALARLVASFKGSPLFPIVSVAALTGMRRGEILALRFADLDVAKKTLRIDRSIEVSKAGGVRFKRPKTSRGRRTITIDDGLVTLLVAERDKYLRLVAGVPPGAGVDLSLVRAQLPQDALIFPSLVGADEDLTRPRSGTAVSDAFAAHVRKHFPDLHVRFHDLRGLHETLQLDAGTPVHVIAARCGHDPATLLCNYARRTASADTKAAATIGPLSRAIFGA